MQTKMKSFKPKKKPDKTPYVVTLTAEQIMLIRSFALRMEMLWMRAGVAVNVCRDGLVERVPMWECLFCQQGSMDGVTAIQHTSDCIVSLATVEWEKMNAEFIKAEEAAKEQQEHHS